MIVAIRDKSFAWDPKYKGNDIEISNNDTVLSKKDLEDYESVLGVIPLNSGRYYWEITIDNANDSEDIVIGIATKELNLYSQPQSSNKFWGYFPCSARKIGHNIDRARYGEPCICNDIVGVLLEFSNEQCKLSFYRNQVME